MLDDGWVKVWRSILDHPLFTQCPDAVVKVFIACLVRANWQPTKWFDGQRQIDIPAGAFIFSQEIFSKQCHVSRQKLRTALWWLTKLQIITIQTTNRYSLLVIEKWTVYQLLEGPRNQQLNQQITNRQPTDNQQITTEEEVKKLRREEKDTTLTISWDWEIGFSEWWTLWSRVRGTQRHLKASEAYAVTVTPATRQAALDCTDSYLASLDRPNQGFYPDTFLRQQAEDGFKARFPARKPQNLEDRVRDTAARNLLKFGRI